MTIGQRWLRTPMCAIYELDHQDLSEARSKN